MNQVESWNAIRTSLKSKLVGDRSSGVVLAERRLVFEVVEGSPPLNPRFELVEGANLFRLSAAATNEFGLLGRIAVLVEVCWRFSMTMFLGTASLALAVVALLYALQIAVKLKLF